jgi:GDP-mannose 6-dehydrogenase
VKISIFGLGYVGAVTAACFARDGHEVIGVDVSPEKVALVSEGKSPIVEPGLGELLAEGIATNRIRATTDAEEAVLASDASLISVGTPSTERGETDLNYVFGVCKEIGAAIRKKAASHAIVLRSTVPPGTLEQCHTLLKDIVGAESVHLAFNPEFLREGSAIRDYDAPPYTIIGTEDPVAEEVVRQMYAKVDAPIIVAKPAVAEMVKFVANTWHAAKISFANEIGRISKRFRHRWTGCHEHYRARHQTKRLPCLYASWLRLRGFLPSQGLESLALLCKDNGCSGSPAEHNPHY